MNIKSVGSHIILVEDSKVDQEHRNRAESQPNICYCEKNSHIEQCIQRRCDE